MAGKKSGRALEKEGLQRTDNGLPLTSIPQVAMINQKNYYTDFLKRDDQMITMRLQNEETRNRMTTAARDKDRALAQTAENGPKNAADVEMTDGTPAVEGEPEEVEDSATKIIIIHPGSQNLRIGLATDALPKTVPMVIAKRSPQSESEEYDGEPLPKRARLTEDYDDSECSSWYGPEFASEYNAMAAEFKTSRRVNKRRVLPNSRELVLKWNSQTPPDLIPQHNDQLQIEWTEVDNDSPYRITGPRALRIPDASKPRYRLSWPWQHGWLNEGDYTGRRELLQDFFSIIEDAIVEQMGVRRKKDLAQFSCVFVIPDLYEKVIVASVLHELLRDFGFNRVSFVQESLAATFGAGYSSSCVVDVGAQKTSIACVEEGLCLENTRVNLKFGGEDVTQTFIKMMLFDRFNYDDMNLRRRHDWLLAEELKQRFCTLADDSITVQQHEFFLRTQGQDTRKYMFKIYDEGALASMGFYRPNIFDHSDKLKNRRRFIDRSRDTYDGSPNDPITPVQILALQYANENVPSAVIAASEEKTTIGFPPSSVAQTPKKQNGIINHTDDITASSPVPGGARSPDRNGNGSMTGGVSTPKPESTSTANQGANGQFTGTGTGNEDEQVLEADPTDDSDPLTDLQARTVPLMPLEHAILASITEGAKGDERKLRDFLGGIMVIGGGAKTPYFNAYLEHKLRVARPDLAKDILVGPPPRELDGAVVVWKGASVFGKLEAGNECWIGGLEYDRLGARVLNYKCMWTW